MFREVNPKVNYPEMERGVIEFWRRTGAFHKVQDLRRDGPVFTFYEGPPTANGMPHIGHVLPRSIKDLFPRYKTMLGYFVPRKAGWDTHGLPVELEVEKKLGLRSKGDIEAYGVEKFIEQCKESVWKYEKEWTRLTERIGFWLDLDNAYVTYHNTYIESVWWALKTIWDKGWLYQGYRIVPYCARCGTSLSSHEVAQGYAEADDPSVYVTCPLETSPPGGNDRPAALLVWTTTPWTLPSNTAVAVHPEFDYVACVPEGETDERALLVAAALAPTVFPQGYRALYTVKGRDLVGLAYRPLFPFLHQALASGGSLGATGAPVASGVQSVCVVVPGEYVSLDEGTGLVHIAPAFGEEDMNVAREIGLPIFRPIDGSGRFTSEVPPWEGVFVKEADPAIVDALRENARLYRSEVYRHVYPFCYRCHAPLLYYADTGWFIRMTAVKDELIALNRGEVTWYPEHLREGRFGDWLENMVDWNLSRDRYWGTPLPVWECRARDCTRRLAVGSFQELRELAQPGTLPEPFDPHKPYIDRVVIPCPDCGGEMRRVPEVIDCWFDSGAMPFAQWHYPFEHREVFDRHFPAEFICEAIDQTRGWFYSLLAISTVLFGRPAYRNVLVTEFGVDEEGRKMSKHIGNVFDPWSVLDDQGADALRWYLYAVSHPWFQKRFSARAISEFQSRMQDTLWNVYAFFVLYANLDRFEPDPGAVISRGRADTPPPAERGPLDRWILSRLHRVTAGVRESLDAYQVLPATRAIEDFIDDLSNWYVRRGRRRYWRAGSDQDKAAAYQTLYEVLVTLSRLLAPFIPFTSEEIYQNLARSAPGRGGEDRGAAAPASDVPESVHHCLYPEADPVLIDEALERRMETVRRYVALARAARNRAHIRTRQPLRRVVLVGPVGDLGDLEGLTDLLTDEVNVKETAVAADLSGMAVHTLKPRFDLLGPRLGPLAPMAARALNRLTPDETAAAVKSLTDGRSLAVTVEGQEEPVTLSAGEVEIRTEGLPGWSVEGDDGRYVALDTEISPELLWEGLAREAVNRVQRLRKEAGFDVEDQIETVYRAGGDLAEALRVNHTYVAAETLSASLAPVAGDGPFPLAADAPSPAGAEEAHAGWHTQTLDVDGEIMSVAIRRLPGRRTAPTT